jgi:large repetitive protein
LREARWLQFAPAMRTALCLVLLAACGIQNKVAPNDASSDAIVTGDGSGSGDGSATELTISLTDKPVELGNHADVSFFFTTSIPATTECKVDDAAYAPCTSPAMATGLLDTMHTFDVRATAGDQHAAIPTYSFTVDTKAPAMMITGQPAMASPVATAQFYFQKDDATTVMCQVDTAAAAPCTSPVMYSGLPDGTHVFTVTGTDGAGNAATQSYSWAIDTTTPQLAITSEPPNPSTSASAQFQFTTGGVPTVTCQLDSGAASACTSPKTYSGLADGSHTFTLVGTNAAGTMKTLTYTWSVDATPPSVSISSGPASVTNVTTAQFQFTVTGATTVTCKLDAGTPAACTSPWSYTGLADGSHTFTLVATDAAGNSTTKTASWTVDTMPPSLSITSSPPDPSSSTSAQVAFTVSGTSTVTCSLDGAAATACTSPVSYSGLADGMHTVTVRATDAAGNATTKTATWTVDTTPPALTLTSTPPSVTAMTDAQFAFTAVGAATVSCQLDGAAATACTSPTSYSGLAESTHTFTLRGTDAAGNTATKSYTWTVDATPPAVTLTATPSNPSNSASASFSFTAAGATTTCSIDGGAAAACTSPATYTSLADGSHTFAVNATDGAGNTSSQSYTWTIDSTAPTVTISNPPPAYYSSTSVSISFTVSEPGNVTCQLDGGAQALCSSPYTASGFANGSQHSLVIRATDAAGNTGTASAVWNVDTSAPTVTIYSYPALNSNSRTATIYFAVSDGTTTCALDNVFNLAPCSNPVTYTNVADGSHTVYVYSRDAAGNTGSTYYSWNVDATPPAIGTLNVNCSNSTGLIDVSWTVSEAHSYSGTCQYPSGTGVGSCMTGWSGNLRPSGSVFIVTLTDAFGNTSTKSKSISTLACTD